MIIWNVPPQKEYHLAVESLARLGHWEPSRPKKATAPAARVWHTRSLPTATTAYTRQARSCLRPARFIVCTHPSLPAMQRRGFRGDRSLLAAGSSHGDWPDNLELALDHGDGGPAPAVGRAEQQAPSSWPGWSRNTHPQTPSRKKRNLT